MAKKKQTKVKPIKATRVRKLMMARVIGPIPHQGYGDVLWKLRLVAPRFPFYIDSALCFQTREQAEKEAKKWRERTVTIRTEPVTIKGK